jgi:hypothetical protein
MPVPVSDPQGTQAAIGFLVILAAVLCVVYWRIALRVLLVAAIALIVIGTIIGSHDLSSVMSVHHR